MDKDADMQRDAGSGGLPETRQSGDEAFSGGRGRKAGAGRSRIAQTARRLQAEAAEILSEDRPPLVLPGLDAGDDALPSGIESCLGEEERAGLGEVTDAAGLLLLCMPPDQALRRGLRLRVCSVALRTREGKVILHRRKKAGDGAALWDLYTGHVLPGEAWEDAALRLLDTWAGTAGSRLARLSEIVGDEAGGAHIRYYGVALSSGLYPRHAPADTLEADRDELAGLAQAVPELLSIPLLLAAREGIIFPKAFQH
ncbi:MAG: NUDIX hydrolase [Desulfovibrio sp.]|jgi:ADP-ribose pyrophosphatase YjhB (NUDIX family)|nr:NUDIX hydrolase [Desulfovibrio sp.]